MSKLIITGKRELSGEIITSSSKNSSLPIIAASILGNGTTRIINVPNISDVKIMIELLRGIGAKVDYYKNTLSINPESINCTELVQEISSKIRASFQFLGPFLAKYGKAKIYYPGGCNIGTRPIELHLKGLSSLGAYIIKENGFVEVMANKLIGTKIYLDFPSVGATENILMASVLAEGETTIDNAAEEPEITDLANFLNKMGARIYGAGTDSIKITGVNKLTACSYEPIPDRIEAGTYMVAAAITRSKIKIKNVHEDCLKPVSAKLKEMGVNIESGDDAIIVDGKNELKCTDIKTMPFPGFPTDMQAQIMALLSTVKGTSIITETVFENRFNHINEFNKMGTNISVSGKSAIIQGVDKIRGCKVCASDLRAGAALVLMGLCAEGDTEIADMDHIERGYDSLHLKLENIGAQIFKV
ncbi:MAG: UDP-N-acetylglucosamine 1-carboxyvinyltransferase [Oscillospiraceae bacterium]|nr:UDP-N-acetylglucosamine 1-carboxyvinyltransferase [Oscillospiraceae bacterium]